MARYLGFDVGATNTLAAVADADGTVLGRHDRSTPHAADGGAIADAVREAGAAACRDAGVDPEAVERAAVATVARIDRDRGGVDHPANLPADFVPLVDRLEGLAGEVLLCNDATAGALGELEGRSECETRPEGASRRGERRPEGSRGPAGASPSTADGEVADLAFVTFSTGIGAGVIADGRVLEGHRGNAGEVGHLTLEASDGPPCSCGGDGHWEAFCSGDAIPRYARFLADEGGIATDLDLDAADAADVLAAAGEDPLADRVVDRLAARNAQGVAAVVHAYDPGVVALGGPVALENPDVVVEPLRDRLPEFVHVLPVPEVRLAAAGADAALRGAIHRAVEGPP